MNTSAFQIMKDSCSFLWNHKLIMVAMVVFGSVAIAICTALAAMILLIAWLILGTDALLMVFNNLVVGIVPVLTPWILIALLALVFVGILLMMFYPRVCSAVYVLHALRSKPISIGGALRQGMRCTLHAWQIVLGCTLVPAMFLVLGLIFMLLNVKAGIVFTAIAGFFIIWFFIATYFIEQLVADGATDFAAAVATSWNYVKRSWWQLSGVVFFLWLTNVLFSALVTPLFFSLIGFVVGGWYAVASNKVYRVVKTESDYKYSSE